MDKPGPLPVHVSFGEARPVIAPSDPNFAHGVGLLSGIALTVAVGFAALHSLTRRRNLYIGTEKEYTARLRADNARAKRYDLETQLNYFGPEEVVEAFKVERDTEFPTYHGPRPDFRNQ